MRLLRDLTAAGFLALLAAACQMEDREFVDTPPAEEELDIRTTEEPAPPTQPAPSVPQDTMRQPY